MEQTVIKVKGLTKQYKKQTAVKDAAFTIKRGSSCGLSEKELAKARERMSFMIEAPYAKLDLTAWKNLEKQRIQKGIPDKERPGAVMELVGFPMQAIRS